MLIYRILFLFVGVISIISSTYSQQSITGLTWIDSDENGIRNNNETFISEMDIELFLESGIMIQFTSSDSEGNYSFDNLPEGNYFLKFQSETGLKFTLRNIGNDNFDSDVMQTGFSEVVTISSSSPNVGLDAGLRSSIVIINSALITACQGSIVNIIPTVQGFSGDLRYHWSHDNSTEPTTSITVDSSFNITFTVTDKWNLPITKNIFVKVSQGLTLKNCNGIDLFDELTSPIDLMVSKSNPGPTSQVDIDQNILGGQRTITIEQIEGENASNINASADGVFINNCAGCRAIASFEYSNPNGGFIDLTAFRFIELNEVLLDQGNIDITITIEGDNITSIIEDRLETEGSTTEFTKLIYFSDFSNADQIDLSKVKSLNLTLRTLNESTDFKMGSIRSCFDATCVINLEESIDICLNESATLSPSRECENAVIYQWDNLGFGREQTVTPTDTTTYNLTIFDQTGCFSTYVTTVNVSQPPSIEIMVPAIACFSDEISIEAIATGHPPFSYEWNISSIDSSSVSFTIDADTFIEVTVTDSLGCRATAQELITVFEKPSITLTSEDSKCSAPTGSATANINGGTPPYTINWSNGTSNQTTLANIDAGTYIIEIIDANGCTTQDSITINYLPCAEIGNYVWHDINYNGIQDISDEPIVGVIVILRNNQNAEVLRDTTDINGHYLFLDLESGEYYVEFLADMDYYPTIRNNTPDITKDSNIDSITFQTELITLTNNEKNQTIDAGLYKKVCIGDQVWNDNNQNDIFDDLDTGISDVLVKLFDCNQSLLDSTLTNSDGIYEFCNLLPGSYSLTFCDLNGYIPVTPNVGNESIDSDIDEQTSSIECKNLMSGDTLNNCDAGFILYSSIGDYVWHDINADGLQDSNDIPISDIHLNLYNCDSILIDYTITDSLGYYIFDSLVPGNYYIQLSLPSNSILTEDSIGTNRTIDSDFTFANNSTSCIELPEGTHLTVIDAGIYYSASIGDYVWIDSNLDGLQNSDESGFENMKIYLNTCDGILVDSTYSDAEGFYIFDSLTPGSYNLSIALPNSTSVTQINSIDNTTNNDINATTLISPCVTLISNEHNEDLDIGIYQLSKIGDYVWFDSNGNNIQDTTETGVPNITVTLLDCSNEMIATIETDSNGYYCFNDIPYGDYSIHFDIPAPYFLVNNNVGNDSTIDSDPNDSTLSTDCFTVDSPSENTIDAGITTCSNIGGTAWFDHAYLNDIQDPIENGVNGVKVKVYQAQGNNWNLIETTYTGHKPGTISDDGYWEMCVPPGDYYVKFSNIKVLDVVAPNVGFDEYTDSDAVHVFGINTTDIITVQPGVDKLSVGIGYKWKTLNGTVSKSNSHRILPPVFKIENDRPIFTSSENNLNFNSTKSKSLVSVYPNPSNGTIYLSSSISGEFKYSLYDISGNEIIKSKIVKTSENKNIQINIDDKISGTYYLLVESLNHTEFIPIIKI